MTDLYELMYTKGQKVWHSELKVPGIVQSVEEWGIAVCWSVSEVSIVAPRKLMLQQILVKDGLK